MYIEQFFIEDDQYLQFLIFTPLGLRTILAHWVEIHSELAFLSKLKGLKNVKKSNKFIWRYLKFKQSWEIFSNLVAFHNGRPLLIFITGLDYKKPRSFKVWSLNHSGIFWSFAPPPCMASTGSNWSFPEWFKDRASKLRFFKVFGQ